MLSARELSPALPSDTREPGVPTREKPDEGHLRDRLAIVFRHVRLIVGAFAAVVTIAMLESYSATPMYQTTARIVIQDERAAAVAKLKSSESEYWQDVELYLNTQYRILQSRGLARRVLRTLPPPPAVQPSTVSRALSLPREAIAHLKRKATTSAAEPEPPSSDETAAELASIGEFLGGLEIVPVKGTRLVEINYSSPEPKYAAQAANTLAREYVAQNLELKLASTTETIEWLTAELGKQRSKVEAAERAMAEYQEAQNAISLDDRQNIVIARLNSLNDAVTKAKTARLQKEAAYRQLGKIKPDDPEADNYPAIARNPAIQEIKLQLANLSSERARLSQRYGPQHPEMEKVAKQIDATSTRLQGEIAKALESTANDYRAAVTEEQNLTALLEDQKGQAIDLNRKNITYSILEREAESERQVYNALLQQEKELRVVSNSRANNVQIMDEADVPGGPYTPNHSRDWLMALMLGLAAGLALAYAVDYLDDTVKLPDDVTRRLQLPLLGLVPTVGGKTPPILTRTASHDFGEAFRAIRTSLVFVHGAQRKRIIAVTSTQPLEGKTTTACNLAVVLAIGGSRVLLIDGDMRRPCLHRMLGLSNDVGLSQVLSGQAQIEEALQPTDDSNLVVMSAGQVPPNPAELLSSPRLRQMFASVIKARAFDWVIIDTPPVLAVTDAVILAPLVSGLVFVTAADMTRRAHVERAIQILKTGAPNVVGVVLNRIDFNRNKYYYSRYYGYHHTSYYSENPLPKPAPAPKPTPNLAPRPAARRALPPPRPRPVKVRVLIPKW
jgi:capsular exopolysaccharide synthesis family protein